MINNGEHAIPLIPPASRVAHVLRTRIRCNKYSVGERLSNERDLSMEFSVSRGTIRQALDILEGERLLIRQQGRGTFVANPADNPLVSERAALLGILVWEREYYFERIITSASLQASRHGYMLTTGSNATEDEGNLHVDSFLKNSVRGVVFAPCPVKRQSAYKRLAHAGVPVVLLDTMIPGYHEDYVGVDNRLGTYMATKHLIDLGHCEIGYVGHDSQYDIPCGPERYKGYLDACEGSSLAIRPEWVVYTEERSCEERLQGLMRRDRKPTAVVCYNDTWAVRVAAAARKTGIRIPEDLSVVGFDDSALARSYDIPITSVNPEHRELGIAAVDLLTGGIENLRKRPGRKVLIQPTLIARHSTARPGRKSQHKRKFE